MLSSASTKSVEKRTKSGRGLGTKEVAAALNCAGANGHSVNDVTNLTVKEDKRQAGPNHSINIIHGPC